MRLEFVFGVVMVVGFVVCVKVSVVLGLFFWVVKVSGLLFCSVVIVLLNL